MSRKLSFSPSVLDALSSGSISDPLTPGLSLERLPSGKKVWRYVRWVPINRTLLRRSLGSYPAYNIPTARAWADDLNCKIDSGTDPRELEREEIRRASMTVARAHAFYMEAVMQGRASRAKRKNKPRTISDKKVIFQRDIEPSLGSRIIYDVKEDDLIKLVERKGKTAPVRANRLAAELKVFFGWAASLRGREVGLEHDPARRLGDLRFVETPRSRKLGIEELEWFLRGLSEEKRDIRRGMLLWLLTATRFSELVWAKSSELQDGIWTIPAERSKNHQAHRIALGPWGQALFHSNAEWVFPAHKVEGPKTQGWYEARDRILQRMSQIAGHPVAQFTPHDFRRTARSNTKRLNVDYETAEAMLNHMKAGLERIYDRYDLEEEKRQWFARWESEIADLARRAGVHELLEVPGTSRNPSLPESAAVEPGTYL